MRKHERFSNYRFEIIHFFDKHYLYKHHEPQKQVKQRNASDLMEGLHHLAQVSISFYRQTPAVEFHDF